jgi:Mg-chelatase subunit ChlD
MKTFHSLFAAAALMTAAPALAEQASASPAQNQQQATDRPRVDVAFVLDTTGSMGGLLEGAKQKIWSIASQIAHGKPAPILRVGIVAYRDRGDAYIAQRFDLTRDLDGVYAHLKTLKADGGGDTPEHVGRGLGEAVKNMTWSAEPNTMKLIFLVGDAPPQHYNDGWDPEVWAKRAHKEGIVVNTIRCGGDGAAQEAFQEIARLTDGTYSSIDGSGGVVAVRTPYDDKLAALNGAIASKTVYAGAPAARKDAEKKAKGVAALEGMAAADRLSYAGALSVGGAGAAYAPAAPSGAVDLVTKPEAVATLPTTELPEGVRGLDEKERAPYLQKLAQERKQLEGQAAKVAADRDEWIRHHVKEEKDSFDGKVMERVRTLGAAHGIAY